MKSLSIAVDIGGTFTDLLAFDEGSGQIHQAKCLSTPPDFATGVLDGVKKAALDLSHVESFVHGSTVAINTAIERTGARTALLVTRGTRDVYQIARGNRPESYNILFQRAEPLAPPHLTFEVTQRTTAWGEALIPFDEAQARQVAKQVLARDVDAIAICFLHSYQDPTDEIRMRDILRELDGSKFITMSHEIVRRSGEYERISTTALNAYIGPRTSTYLSNLETLLGRDGFDGRLLIMQSNGGLMAVDSAKRVPVAMMESGPVGGVIAAAQISTNLGYENSIAFDMGGTTAKTSLVHGREPSVAEGYYIGGYADGHPAMMPVVDIVEVGTGGGSIAWIDEVGALKVGPQSAGAAPGPICYCRGGTKPTVTDANVILGRIGVDSFLGGEMALDRDAAVKATAELGRPLGLDAVATALSIVQIAVAKMSLAVRGVSVERGFDPRDFVMVGMGGAGPIHAVAIARQLHIPIVVIPVLPSHFSAFGMLMSDIRHDYVRTYLSPLSKLDFSELRKIFAEMLDGAERMLAGERVAKDAMTFQRYLDLRYEGQEFAIKVPVSEEEIATADLQTIRNRFDAIHDRSFGHAAPNEALEMVNIRLSARGIREKLKMPAVPDGGKPVPRTFRKVCLENAEQFEECPVYARDTLSAGAEIKGPALIEEYGSTTVLFASDSATISKTGEIIIQVGSLNMMSQDMRKRLDPVTLEVIRNAFPAISNEMSYDLQRTSYNMMIYEVCDYSCTLLDTDGKLISQNIGGVSHFIADMGVVMKDGIARYGLDGFAPGDVVITNHQAVAGQHLNNIVIYTPFFFEGVLRGFPAVRAHWVDIGGLSTGFGALGSTDAWSEGLQLNQLKIYEAGKPDNKLLQVISDNIRFPQAAMGDLRSQIAACRLAERRLEELYKRYGVETIAAALEIIYSETERKCRAVVETIPDGVYEADNYIDAPGAKEPLVHVHVKVTVSGSDMTIDFTGTSPQTSGNNNSRTLAGAYIAYKGLTTPLEPANEGSFRALKAIVPEGSIMMAKFPAAMADWASPIPGSVDAIFKALAPAIPDRIPAGHFGYMMIGRSFTGYDPRRGRSFVLQTIDGGGWGGRPTQDGPSGSVTVCQGDVRNAPIESIEQKCPVIVEARELLPDTAGPGKFRGGLGLRLQVKALEEGRWGLPPHRRCTYPPWGLWGGKLGRGGSNWVKTPEDNEWKQTPIYRLPVTKGTVIRAQTTGGGGWGDPLDRDPERVLTDVLNGYVSKQGAREDYGVVIDDEDRIDLKATEKLRADMRAQTKAVPA